MDKLWQFIKSPGVMAVLAILGFGLAIFQQFFYEKRGQVFITLDAPARVFDLHRPVGGLEVAYAGENLRSSKKTLWVIGATVTNAGNAEIKKGDYDELAPLGLQINGGQLVDVPALRTTVAYLEKNLKITTNGQRLLFSPVILEPDDSVHVTLLVLGPEEVKPTVTALGKIAGTRGITVVTEDSAESGASVWHRLTQASAWWVHLLRLPLYGIAALLCLAMSASLTVALTSPLEWLSKKRGSAVRLEKIEGYRRGEDLSKELRFLTGRYLTEGDSALQSAYRVIQGVKRRAELHERVAGQLDEAEVGQTLKALAPLLYTDHSLLNELVEKGLIHVERAKPSVPLDLEEELMMLCRYLGVDPEKPMPDDSIDRRMYAQMMLVEGARRTNEA